MNNLAAFRPSVAESANAIAPVSMFGTISVAPPAQISLTYWRGHSFGAHRFDLSDFPTALLAKAIEPVQTPVARLGAHRALEEMFGCASVARVLPVDLGDVP